MPMLSTAVPTPQPDGPQLLSNYSLIDMTSGQIEMARQKNRAFITEHRVSHVLLHSGVVRRGACTVLFPGMAESGKSTLVAGLVRSGWDYLSDELALIDPHSRHLLPYQRPISIDVGAYYLFPELLPQGYSKAAEQWHVNAEDLRPDSGGDAGTPISHVVFNQFEHGSATSVEPISAGSCLSELIANSVHLLDHGAQGFEVLADLAQQTPAFRLESGSLVEQIATIESITQ